MKNAYDYFAFFCMELAHIELSNIIYLNLFT